MQFDVRIAGRRRLSLTPLIDVIFLLLIFFMLSSTFSRFTEIEISGGGPGSAGASRPDVLLTVAEDGVRLNGEFVETGEIATRLTALSEAGAKSAVIAIARDVSSQEFVGILQQASQSPLSVSLARSGR